MHLKNKKSYKKPLRAVSLILSLSLICFTMMGMAYAGDGTQEEEAAPEETQTDLVETLPLEEEFPTPVETSASLPDPEYEIAVTVPDGWFNTQIDLRVSIQDVYASGWQKVEAALSDDAFAERTDMTEQLLAENEASYTVRRNGTVYSVDEIGNCSELLKIANPFYVEPVEETPAPSPDSGEPSHDAHCPADCDCRKQSTSGGNGSPTGSGTSTNAGSGGSTGSMAAKPTTSQSVNPQETAASESVSIEKGTGFTENGSAVIPQAQSGHQGYG